MSKKIEDVYTELNQNQYLCCVIDKNGNVLTHEDVEDVNLEEKQFIMAQPNKINFYLGLKMMNGDISNIVMPEV